MIWMAAVSLWYVANINKTQAQAEQSDKNEVIATPAATFAGTGTGSIPDGPSGCGNYTGTPLDVTFNVTGLTGTVGNVAVQFNASHTYVGDLRAVLVAPGGNPSHIIFSQTGQQLQEDAVMGQILVPQIYIDLQIVRLLLTGGQPFLARLLQFLVAHIKHHNLLHNLCLPFRQPRA
jgi:hypothetical protein